MKRSFDLLLFVWITGIASIATGQTQSSQPAVEIPPAASIMEAQSQDDLYQFAAGLSAELSVPFTRTEDGLSFSWPDGAGSEWDTAILSIKSWGAESNPWIEIKTDTDVIQQYLDPNGLGLRWLNLSAFRGRIKEGTRVLMIPHAVTVDPGSGMLRLFANKLDLGDKILVLAPHPDDAEIAAFGLYADRNATIVTVTSGNAGDMNYRSNVSDPAAHYLLKGYLRAVDSVTVPWQGQIPPDRTFNLGYFDARLATMYASPDEVIPELYGPNEDVAPYRRANLSKLLSNGSRTNTWEHLVEDLSEILRKVKPMIVVMPDPRLDSHRDHQYASVALVQALDKWREKPVFLLYTNHAAANRYPFGPAGTVMSLPPWSASEIHLQRVYSHPVDSKLQLRKLFALESMHDLRLSPEEQDTCDAIGLPLRPDYPRVPEVDYLRRAPRSNELFNVYSRDGVMEVIRFFLAGEQQTP